MCFLCKRHWEKWVCVLKPFSLKFPSVKHPERVGTRCSSSSTKVAIKCSFAHHQAQAGQCFKDGYVFFPKIIKVCENLFRNGSLQDEIPLKMRGKNSSLTVHDERKKLSFCGEKRYIQQQFRDFSYRLFSKYADFILKEKSKLSYL